MKKIPKFIEDSSLCSWNFNNGTSLKAILFTEPKKSGFQYLQYLRLKKRNKIYKLNNATDIIPDMCFVIVNEKTNEIETLTPLHMRYIENIVEEAKSLSLKELLNL